VLTYKNANFEFRDINTVTQNKKTLNPKLLKLIEHMTK